MQHTRQWMVTHKWMVDPMPQTEWILRRGMMVWIAEVFTSLGTGLYMVSMVMGSWWGALIGWLIVMFLKLPLHILYLGKPFRFWRLMPPFTNAWRTSWYPRGVFFTVLFGTFAFIQLVTTGLINPHLISGSLNFSLGSALTVVVVIDILVKIVAVITGILTAMYGGFMMSYLKSVPFWNTGLVPVVFIITGIADGLALIMAVGMGIGGVNIGTVEAATRILLVINAVLIATFLLNASYQSSTAQLSVKELVVGRVAVAFWLGIVVLGIAIPLIISILSLFSGEAAVSLLVLAIICHTLGAFALKYCILKTGIHRPILPRISAY